MLLLLLVSWMCIASSLTSATTPEPTDATTNHRQSGARQMKYAAPIIDPEDIPYYLPTLSQADTKSETKHLSQDLPEPPPPPPPSKPEKPSTEHKKTIVDDDHKKPISNKDESLQTAEAIVYRPLFAYRAQQAERRKVQLQREQFGGYRAPAYVGGGGGGYYQPSTPAYYPQQSDKGNHGYYMYIPQSGKYIHVPYGYPPVPAGMSPHPYQSSFLAPPSNYL